MSFEIQQEPVVDKKQEKSDKKERHPPLKLEEKPKIKEVKIPLRISDEQKKEEALVPTFEKYMDEQLNKAYGRKEVKETKEKSLEFEEDTFKIESAGWRLQQWNVRGGSPIWVQINATGDVLEYLDGPAKGEQIFITYAALIREVCKAKNCSKEEAENKYLMTVEEVKTKMGKLSKTMKNNKSYAVEAYGDFYKNEIKDHLAGCWSPQNKEFYGIGDRSVIWLVGGEIVEFGENERDLVEKYKFGCSGRLLKN